MPNWYAPGLLLLGDAVHPMSPIRAQGINMALRDVIVAANHLVTLLREGATVVTCGTFTATHLGEFQGLPPTGKPIQLSIMHIDRVQNGKITEHWGQGDALGLMQQLGIVFLPGLALVPHILKSLPSKLSRKSRK